MNFLDDMYRLSTIKRYSTVFRIHEESVAEHSFFVQAILVELWDGYVFDLSRAMILALAHDMPEIELNDCPHITKEKYPEIKEAFDICESQVARTLPWVLREAVEEYNKGETIEAKMVHLADVLQCMQYAQVELDMGNRGYMTKVHQKSRMRANALKEELHGYRRSE